MIGEIRQNFTEASASVGLILATALIVLCCTVLYYIVLYNGLIVAHSQSGFRLKFRNELEYYI